jgi:hypothetical protein
MAVYHPVTSHEQHPKLAAAIGDVILAWTEAENAQVGLFAAMLNIPHAKASRLYQKLPNYRSRTQALCALVDLDSGFAELKTFVLKLSGLSKKRNNFIHGLYIEQWGGGDLRLVDLDEPSESPKRSGPTKPNDIHQHAQAVRKCVEEFRAAKNLCTAYTAWSKPRADGKTKSPDPQNTEQESPPPPPGKQG